MGKTVVKETDVIKAWDEIHKHDRIGVDFGFSDFDKAMGEVFGIVDDCGKQPPKPKTEGKLVRSDVHTIVIGIDKSISKIIENIKSCGFACEAGSLENNADWLQLVGLLEPLSEVLCDNGIMQIYQAEIKNNKQEIEYINFVANVISRNPAILPLPGDPKQGFEPKCPDSDEAFDPCAKDDLAAALDLVEPKGFRREGESNQEVAERIASEYGFTFGTQFKGESDQQYLARTLIENYRCHRRAFQK